MNFSSVKNYGGFLLLKYFDDKDRFQMEQCDLLAFSHGQYYTLGEQIGKFGYSVAKKKPKKKRKSKSKS